METDPKPFNDRPWFTAKQAAAYVGIHVETLYEWCRLRKGRPPFVRLARDRRYRFPKDQFIQWANGSDK